MRKFTMCKKRANAFLVGNGDRNSDVPDSPHFPFVFAFQIDFASDSSSRGDNNNSQQAAAATGRICVCAITTVQANFIGQL